MRSRIRGQQGHPATYQAGEGGRGQRAGLPGRGPTRSSLQRPPPSFFWALRGGAFWRMYLNE